MQAPPASPLAPLLSEAAEFRRLLAANDARLLAPTLDDGGEIAAERTAIHTAAIARWAAEVAPTYDRPFAVAAIGGTGRAEMTPCSDLDVVFLFEDPVESEPTRSFVRELQDATLHTRTFLDRFGFAFQALPYAFEDAAALREKDLNAFLDLAPVYDPQGLCGEFRRRIRERFDPFEHFLYVRQFWLRQLERVGAMAERIDRFDLKNDGLRLFLAAVWTLGGRGYEHSCEIYARVREDDPRDLEAYRFLLRLRGWIHLRRPGGGGPTALGNHPEDLMGFEDFDSFGAWLPEGAATTERFEFAEEVRARLLGARRRVAAFARGVIESELRPGRPVSPGNPVALGAGGLYHANPETCVTNQDRSRAALSLVITAQRYDLPIDPSELLTTFHRAGDWLEPVPELAALFMETHGSLAGAFDFLSQLPGAEDRLFPGYGRFESSLDERVRTERQLLRGPLEREKMRELETERLEGERILAESRDPERLTDVGYDIRVEVEAARLCPVQLAAVKLALKTKRLPVTPDDLAARRDPGRSLSERFSSGFSGIPLEDYYTRSFARAEFDPEVLELARFLVANRRTFREIADAGLIDDLAVKELLDRCGGDRDRVRALYVFTRIDRHAWESPQQKPTLFFNIRELYAKACMPEDRRFDPRRIFVDAGLRDRESQEILLDFGRDFYEGIYRHYAVRFCPHLLRLAAGGPKARPKAILIVEGPSAILGVAARDDRGIAASISGTFWKQGIGLSQAHLFSAMNHGLALDFFHLAPPSPDRDAATALPLGDLAAFVEEAIEGHLHCGDEDEAALPDVARHVTLTEWRHGLYRLRAESSGEVGALIYRLCCKASRRLRADVFGVTSQTGRSGAWASVFLRLPETLDLAKAREIVSKWD